MHVISRSRLKEFYEKHTQAKAPLEAWFAEASHARWRSFQEIRELYRSADVIADNRVIFNIGGNKYRLVVRINYESETVFIRFVGTHSDYAKIDSATI